MLIVIRRRLARPLTRRFSLCDSMPLALDTLSSELEAAVGRFAALVRRVGLRHRLSEADLEDVLQGVRIRLWRSGSRPGGGRTQPGPASHVYPVAGSAAR